MKWWHERMVYYRRFSISSSFSRSLFSISERSAPRALLAASRRAWASLRASLVSASSAARLSRSPSSCTRMVVSSFTCLFRSLLALLASRRASVIHQILSQNVSFLQWYTRLDGVAWILTRKVLVLTSQAVTFVSQVIDLGFEFGVLSLESGVLTVGTSQSGFQLSNTTGQLAVSLFCSLQTPGEVSNDTVGLKNC